MAAPKIKAALALYLKAKEAEVKAAAETEKYKKELKTLMGDEEIKVVDGFKISYKPNQVVDADALRSQAPATFFKYLKEPELDVEKFRKEEPAAVVEKYLTDAKNRTFKVSTV